MQDTLLVEALLAKMQELVIGFRAQLDGFRSGAITNYPIGFTKETWIKTLEDTVADLLATLERYGRA